MTSQTSAIDNIFHQVKPFKVPPIEKWSPTTIQNIDIRIATDGRWYYQGSTINRYKIVKLFSTLLVKENNDYFLITPHIKYAIQIDDVPFLAVEMSVMQEQNHQVLYFRTNVDEVVRADSEHPIMTYLVNGETIPYVIIRNGLLAKLTRSVYYQLMEQLVQKNGQAADESMLSDQSLGVYSMGVYFSLNQAGSS